MQMEKQNGRCVTMLSGASGQALCLGCNVCVQHCPVSCIRMEWNNERPDQPVSRSGMPVKVHLGTLVLKAPVQPVPPERMLDRSRLADASGPEQTHLGTLVLSGSAATAPQRQRRRPILFNVDHTACTRCGLCVKLCPVNALELSVSNDGGNACRNDLLAAMPQSASITTTAQGAMS